MTWSASVPEMGRQILVHLEALLDGDTVDLPLWGWVIWQATCGRDHRGPRPQRNKWALIREMVQLAFVSYAEQCGGHLVWLWGLTAPPPPPPRPPFPRHTACLLRVQEAFAIHQFQISPHDALCPNFVLRHGGSLWLP